MIKVETCTKIEIMPRQQSEIKKKKGEAPQKQSVSETRRRNNYISSNEGITLKRSEKLRRKKVGERGEKRNKQREYLNQN